MSDNEPPSMDLVLNEIWGNQEKGIDTPDDKDKKIYSDKEGNIVHGTERDKAKGELSEVGQKPYEAFGLSRYEKDCKIAKRYLPDATKQYTVKAKNGEEVKGFLVRLTCRMGNQYELFMYYTGSNYQVKVVEPVNIENKWKNAHTGHLFSNSTICFGGDYESGQPTLRSAFSKSALWVNGFSWALVHGKFPFNYNQ